MHIGICDDEELAVTYLSSLISSVGKEHTISCFADGREILDHIEAGQSLDLLFLDIDFKDDLDGMKVAARLKEHSIAAGGSMVSLPLIVFVTGMPERMHEAFEVRAFQFLIKPVDEANLEKILVQAEKEIEYIRQREHETDVIDITLGGKQMRIRRCDLKYIESMGRKLHLHTKDRIVECYGKMDEVLSQAGKDFYRVHRSYIVNLSHVFTYERDYVELDDGTKIPMSKYKYKDFLDAFIRTCTKEP